MIAAMNKNAVQLTLNLTDLKLNKAVNKHLIIWLDLILICNLMHTAARSKKLQQEANHKRKGLMLTCLGAASSLTFYCL